MLPFKVNPDWNLITRTIVPVISAPVPVGDRTNGIGDVQLSAFLSPSAPSERIWGAGMVGQAPTASNDVLGQGKWAIGPTAVALHIAKGDPWVYGALINNLGSVGGHGGNFPDVNQMLLQPFINYNFPDAPGRYLSFSPIITDRVGLAVGVRVNIKAGLGTLSRVMFNLRGQLQLTRPTFTGINVALHAGIGIGQIMKWGSQPVNLQAGAYYRYPAGLLRQLELPPAGGVHVSKVRRPAVHRHSLCMDRRPTRGTCT